MIGLKWLLAGLLALLAVALAAGAVFVASGGVERYVAARLGDAIGREVTIADAEITEWSLQPQVRLSEIDVANAEWSDTARMARARSAVFRIDLTSLMNGPVRLLRLDIEDLHVLLERSAEGRANWRDRGRRGERAANGGGFDAGRMPRRLQVQDGELTYRNHGTGIERRAVFSRIELAVDRAQGDMELDAAGEIAGEALHVQATSGSSDAGEGRRAVSGSFTLGDARARIDGSLEAGSLDGLDADVELEGPGRPAFLPPDSLPLPNVPAYRLSARLLREGSAWQLESAEAELGRSALEGSVRLATGGTRPLVEADLRGPRIDLVQLFGREWGQPTTADGDSPQDREPAPAGLLSALDADIRLDLDTLYVPNLVFTDVAWRMALEQGRFVVDPFDIALVGGEVTGRVETQVAEGVLDTHLDLRLAGVDLADLLVELGIEAEGFGPIDGDVDLAGEGATPLRFLATASGSVALTMQGGRLDRLLLQAARQDISDLLEVFFGDTGGTVETRCVIADFAARDGLFDVQRLIVDLAGMKIVGMGAIDFDDYTVDVRLQARDQDFGALSGQEPIHLHGDLASPDAELSEDAEVEALQAPVDLGIEPGVACAELAIAARENYQIEAR